MRIPARIKLHMINCSSWGPKRLGREALAFDFGVFPRSQQTTNLQRSGRKCAKFCTLRTGFGRSSRYREAPMPTESASNAITKNFCLSCVVAAHVQEM